MITAHCLIKNEENFLWYSVISVIDYVDKIIITDTGSTDKTREIVNKIKEVYKNKIDYKEIGQVDKYQYSLVRQKMLEETKTDWIMVLDGDEIWWQNSIGQVIEYIKQKGNETDSIIVPTINLVGDVFHYQEKEAGRYNFNGRVGHYNLRFINRRIPGLKITGDYPLESFIDANNTPLQNRNNAKMIFLDTPYIHATHIPRSSNDEVVMQRRRKLKYELGIAFPKDFYYPESFFKERPDIVPNIWNNMNAKFKFRAFIETPLRKIKRRIT